VTHLPNVLFVTHRVPFPPDKGDRIRDCHLLRLLGKHGRVHLATLVDEPVSDEAVQFLSGTCAKVTAVPVGRFYALRGMRTFLLGGTFSEGVFRSGRFATAVRQLVSEVKFDVAVASATGVARYLRLPGLQNATKVVDMVDVDSEKWYDYAAASDPVRKWVYESEARQLRKRETAICRWADAVTVASSSEAAMLRELAGTTNVHAVTSGVDTRYYTPAQPGPESGCLFMGSLNTPQNVDAITWFAQTVWPHLRHRRPEARLRIIGRRPAPAVRAAGDIPGIEVLDNVSDVRPYLAQTAVVVAPVRLARGLQTKVLEAMSSGKAVIATPEVLAGFDSQDLPAKSAAEPDEWVESVCWLLENDGERRRLGQAGRRYVERYHDWNACLEPFRQALHRPERMPVGIPT